MPAIANTANFACLRISNVINTFEIRLAGAAKIELVAIAAARLNFQEDESSINSSVYLENVGAFENTFPPMIKPSKKLSTPRRNRVFVRCILPQDCRFCQERKRPSPK